MASKYSKSKLEFLIIMILAIIVSYIPILRVPFSFITTFFHEISHGLVALLTGGSIEKIRLHLDGSGLCYVKGGITGLIAFAGYLGAVLWGVLIFSIASSYKSKNIKFSVLIIMALILVSAILWARDLLTWVILAIIFLVFLIVPKLKDSGLKSFFLKFIACFVMLDALKSPLNLIDGKHYGDGARLADLTHVPEIIWVAIWLFLAFFAIYYMWKRNFR